MLLIESQSDLSDLALKAEVDSDFSSQVHHLNSLIQSLIFQDPDAAWPLLQNLEALLHKNECQPAVDFYYKKAIYFNNKGNFDEAEKIFQKIAQSPQFLPTELLHAHILADFTACLLNKRKFEKATNILDLLKQQPLFKANSLLQAKVLIREAHKLTLQKKRTEAILKYLEANKLLINHLKYKYIDVEFLRFQLEVGLGTMYELKLEPHQSLQHYKNALHLVEKMHFHFRKAWIFYKVGHSYLVLSKNNQAKSYLQKPLQLEQYRDLIPTAGSLADLGYIAMLENRYDEAHAYFDEALILHEEKRINAPDQAILLNRWLGTLYIQQNDRDKAIGFLSKAVELAKDNNDLRMHSMLLKDIAKYYRAIQEFDKAYDYLNLHTNVQERYMLKLQSEQRLDLEVKYEAEINKQEMEIMRLEANKLQLKALRSQMNPHFIYNSLNAIQLFIMTGQTDDAALHLSAFAKLIRQSLEFSDKDFIRLDQELSFLRSYLELNCKLRFDEKFTFNISVPSELESEHIKIPSMILQPYIENAIEHGIKPLQNKKGLIDIRFETRGNNAIICHIQDNGVGIKKTHKNYLLQGRRNHHRSMGTSITKKRLEFLNLTYHLPGQVKVQDLSEVSSEQGTLVSITLPVKWD